MNPRGRHNAILAELAFEAGNAATLLTLQQGLERTHSIPATRAMLSGDLQVLSDMGLVKVSGDLARLTDRGMDVVRGRAELPEA